MSRKISFCMIVKNEEANLDKCLNSIKGYVDEIIIIDTGSKDRTPEIAKKYADKFEVFTKCNDANGLINDFSMARQYSFDLASYDWICWADGDDIIENAKNFRLLTSKVDYAKFSDKDALAFSLPYDYARNEKGICTHLLYRERLLYPKKNWKWMGRIHECVVVQDNCSVEIVKEDSIRYIHNTHGKFTENRRNLRILRDVYNSKKYIPRDIYYFGRELVDHAEYEEGIKILKEYVEVAVWDDEKYYALMKIVEGYSNIKKFHDAVEYCHRAIIVKPNWSEAYFFLCKLYNWIGLSEGNKIIDWERCYHFGKIGISLPRSETVLWINDYDRDVNVYKYINIAQFHLGFIEEAIKSTDIVLEYEPHDSNIRHNREVYKKVLNKEPLTPIPKKLSTPRELKKIIFFTGHALEPWIPNTLNTKGLGGSETAAIYMSKNLAAKGYDVSLYGFCQGLEGIYDGVKYIHYDKFNNIEADIAIISRQPYAVEYPGLNFAKTFCWVHDVIPNNLNQERDSKIDKYFTLSNWHKQFVQNYYPHMKKEKVLVTRNGIILDRFKNRNITRNRFKAMYTSSPDRGLDILLDVWPKIKEQVPQAELHLYYGFYNWEQFALINKDEEKLKEIQRMKQKIADHEKYDVHMHGRVNQQELADEMLGSGVLTYPSTWLESSCISAMEAQAAGMRIITTPIAALAETVGDNGVLINLEPRSEEYQKIFVEETIKAMKNEDDSDRQIIIQKAMDRFSWEKVADEWEQIFIEELK